MTLNENKRYELFMRLYNAGCEKDVDAVLNDYPDLCTDTTNWRPLGGNQSNFGVIENQQASPIASLIEKITNSIDAILTRRCIEEGIKPNSKKAPRSMQEAVARFFPNHKLWDYDPERRKQAESIQILAHGPRRDTSLVIYDDGEGQHPKEFEDTFLSLLRGNKNDIHFVQGKYNMGGSGAIVFCGHKRYQLIGSRRYRGNGPFGFTLVRKHPLTEEEGNRYKNTWYEYLVIGNEIPWFNADKLHLGLYKRTFTTGTVIKLFSYDLPSGIADIARDLNQSINEYLFEPALPIYTIEDEQRYPKAQRERHLYGLKRRLEQDRGKYVEESFSEDVELDGIGKLKATCYVFRTRVDGKSAKETRETVSREFFKNNMSVLFSFNGQVHGHFTSEFITRSLKMNLLKNYLLIHVDCSELLPAFRGELTMASRDRLKGGEESRKLRSALSALLAKSQLAEINKRRKEALDLESGQTDELVRNFAENLPLSPEMAKLVNQVFKLDKVNPREKKPRKTKKETNQHEDDFQPKRFPAYFKLDIKDNGETPSISIPKGSERTVRFSTDVEDSYFDRVEEPGDLQVALLDYQPNSSTGGTGPGSGTKLSNLFNVRKSSPDKGTIRIHLQPTEKMNVGESAKIMATLKAPGQKFEQTFWVKVQDPANPPKSKNNGKDKEEADKLGLPEFVLVAQKPDQDGWISWDTVEEKVGVDIDYGTVMHPVAEGDVLTKILINMDSKVWKDYRSNLGKSPTEEQLQVAQRKYIASVYFHTVFLYMIMKSRKYQIIQNKDDAGKDGDKVSIEEYLKDVFRSYYADFLLNFSMGPLMEALEE